jgi:hypothetical protein
MELLLRMEQLAPLPSWACRVAASAELTEPAQVRAPPGAAEPAGTTEKSSWQGKPLLPELLAELLPGKEEEREEEEEGARARLAGALRLSRMPL